jgi:hypothetical protein
METKMLEISYRFDTNRSSRSGMRFSFDDTVEAARAEHCGTGETYNGLTPTTSIVVDNSTDAMAFINRHVGQSWPSWSLWYVMPSDGSGEFYHLAAHMSTVAQMKKKLGHAAQRICGQSNVGETYDANVKL